MPLHPNAPTGTTGSNLDKPTVTVHYANGQEQTCTLRDGVVHCSTTPCTNTYLVRTGGWGFGW